MTQNYIKKNSTVLIGAGYWGTNIAKNLLKINNDILIYDKNKKNLNLIKKKFSNKIRTLNNYKKILVDKNIKNLIFATPPSQNFKLVSKALLYGKKIFLDFNQIHFTI